jgi:hypothetical protein
MTPDQVIVSLSSVRNHDLDFDNESVQPREQRKPSDTCSIETLFFASLLKQ